MPSGDHTVAVTADGYEPQTVTRRVVDSATEIVEVQLTPKPARLTIASAAGAHVAVNGRPIGDAPIAAHELAAGSYLVGITRRGREPIVEQVELQRGESRTLTVDMHPTSRRRAVPWLGISAGALAVVAGGAAIFAFHYDGEMQDIEKRREGPGISEADLASYRADTSDRDGYRDAAWIIGGTAVGLGIAAAALYYFDTPQVGEHAIVPTVRSPAAAASA